jgi:hypothetical protein
LFSPWLRHIHCLPDPRSHLGEAARIGNVLAKVALQADDGSVDVVPDQVDAFGRIPGEGGC